MNSTWKPFNLYLPTQHGIPLICDSPHSGDDYPADMEAAVSVELLRQCADSHVDKLWQTIPQFGGTLLAANFPRAYIDPNRALEDLDAAMLDAPWPSALQPGRKSELGIGLIWRNVDRNTRIYSRKLTVEEVRRRIEHCYMPYHATLSGALELAYLRHGAYWHMNLHSMPNNAYERLGIDSPHPLADFVLGDRDGTTCAPEFLDLVAATIRSLGYSVAVNDPYRGVELIGRLGKPAERRHSLQIEIRRPIYMDEKTREPNPGFAQLQRDILTLLEKISMYIRAQCA